jgi:hypothetical protein
MKIKIDVKIYGLQPSTTINIDRTADTIGYCFMNTGNTPVQINNFDLLPNTSWKTFEAGVEDMTIYRARFDQRNNLYTSCGSVNSSLTVIIYSKV